MSFVGGGGFDGTLAAGNIVAVGYGEASHPEFVYSPTTIGTCFSNIPSGCCTYIYKAPITSFSGSAGGSPGVNSDATAFGCVGSPGIYYSTTGSVLSGNSTGGLIQI